MKDYACDCSASVTCAPVTVPGFGLGTEYRQREISPSLASEIDGALNDGILLGRVSRAF